MTTISHMMPPTFDEDGWIRQLFQASDKIIGEPLKKRIDALMKRNSPFSFYEDLEGNTLVDPSSGEKNAQNLWLIRAMAHTLGWNHTDLFQGASNVDETSADFTQEQLNLFTQDELLKVVLDVARFNPVKGTSLWIDFAAYLLNINLNVRRLWYDSYVPTNNTVNPTANTFLDEEIVKSADPDVTDWDPQQEYPTGSYVLHGPSQAKILYRSRYPIQEKTAPARNSDPDTEDGDWIPVVHSKVEIDARTGTNGIQGRRMIYDDIDRTGDYDERATVYPTPYITIEISANDTSRISSGRFENLMRRLIERVAPSDLIIHSYILRQQTISTIAAVEVPAVVMVSSEADDSLNELYIYGISGVERTRLEQIGD